MERCDLNQSQAGIGQSSSRDVTRSDFVECLISSVENPGMRTTLPQAAISISDIFRTNVIIPIGLVTILTTLWWLLVLQPSFTATSQVSITAISEVPTVASIVPKFTGVNFAFLGSYFFGVQMLFRRFVRRDLGPNAYFVFSNRIMIALIGVWLVTAVYAAYETPAPQTTTGASTAILLLAFTIGVFPRVVWQFLSAAGTKLLQIKFVLPSVEAVQPLSELDGLTIWHETRLEEEDVENVPNMATVDIVELMLHTQIPLERLISWIDQAILLTTIGTAKGTKNEKTVESLSALGLRTATQVVMLAESDGAGVKVLHDVLGGNEFTSALVLSLRQEANFDLVHAWRACRVGSGSLEAAPQHPVLALAGAS